MCGDGGYAGGGAMRFSAENDTDASEGDDETVIMRVIADLAKRVGKWSGVDACCDKDIAMGHLRPHFNAWLAETVADNAGKTLVGSGWLDAEVKCESARHPFGRKRCKGWFTKISCYADFSQTS